MSVNTFGSNGMNISENIVKLKLEQNIKPLLYNWSKDVQKKQIFDNFIISLPDKNENIFHS